MILVKNASFYRIIYENGQEEATEAENVQKSVEPGEISSFIQHHYVMRYDVCGEDADTCIPVIVHVAVRIDYSTQSINADEID